MSREDMDNYKERAAKRSKERSDGKTFKLKEGRNNFRILLTPKGHNSQAAFFEFAVHDNVGPNKAYLRCGIDPVTGKGECKLCQVIIPKLRKRGKETRASELEAKSKLVVQVASVVKGKIVGTPKLWYPSGKVGDAVVGTIITSKKRDYLSHKKGYNLSLVRTGTGFKDTRYGMLEADEEPSKVPSSIVEMLKPFDELDTIPKYNDKKINEALGYSSADEDEEDDEEEEDNEPKKKKKSKKSDDDDDDEDDEDDDDDDEDDDADDEDDDADEDEDSDDEDTDDDDDDDEDDDDKPVKKNKKKKK